MKPQQGDIYINHSARSNIDTNDPNKGRSKRVDPIAAILINSNNDHKYINSIISIGRPTLTTIFAFKSPAIQGGGGSFIWISHYIMIVVMRAINIARTPSISPQLSSDLKYLKLLLLLFL